MKILLLVFLAWGLFAVPSYSQSCNGMIVANDARAALRGHPDTEESFIATLEVQYGNAEEIFVFDGEIKREKDGDSFKLTQRKPKRERVLEFSNDRMGILDKGRLRDGRFPKRISVDDVGDKLEGLLTYEDLAFSRAQALTIGNYLFTCSGKPRGKWEVTAIPEDIRTDYSKLVISGFDDRIRLVVFFDENGYQGKTALYESVDSDHGWWRPTKVVFREGDKVTTLTLTYE